LRNRTSLTGLCPAIAFLVAIQFCHCVPARAAQSLSSSATTAPALSPEARQKLHSLQGAVRSAHASKRSKDEAAALLNLGAFNLLISEEKEALEAYNQSLELARAANDQSLQAAALNGIAACRRTEFANDDALSTYQKALDLAKAAGDIKAQATALNGMGWVNDNVGQLPQGLELHNQAYALVRQISDPDLEAIILNRIGTVNDELGNSDKARDFYNQALEKWSAANDVDGQAKALNNLGILSSELSDPPKALDYYKQALPLYHRAGDRAGEAGVLNNIGILYRTTGDEQKALATFQSVLPLFRALGNRRAEAAVLDNIGNTSSELGENQQALTAFNDSLSIHRTMNDPEGQAGALHNIAGVWLQLGEMQKALDALQQALAFWTTAGEHRAEGETLTAIGVVYDDLGQPQQAAEYYVRALGVYKTLDDPTGEAVTLLDIAGLYGAHNQTKDALEQLNLALQLERSAQDRDGEARCLNNMGLLYEDMGQKEKALQSYQQALTIWNQVGNRDGEAQVLNNIGSLLADSGEYEKARAYFVQALPIATAVGDPQRQAQIFHNMMRNERAANPALAIFCGKQAVNLLQHVRGQIQGLDPALQKSYVASKSDYYHDLAALLIAQGRLPEAQQVLDLLKQQEYTDYVRGETASTLEPLILTPPEQQARDDYAKSTSQIVALGEQWLQLKHNNARTEEQEKLYQHLFDVLNTSSKGLNDFYTRLYTTLGGSNVANLQIADVKGDVIRLKRTLENSPRTVALYTLVAKEHYSVILITGATAVARDYSITASDLNAKIAEFQQALRDPSRNPKPMAAELYRILVGPVSADLDQARAETLVWSLDGALRYIPMAALYDGDKYLVEKYNTATITPASISSLDAEPKISDLNAAAMGISRKYEADLPALPAVATELDEVVRAPQSNKVSGAKEPIGALPGTILLNGDFTQTAMDRLLERDFSVVHIASHFVYKPGDDSQSYLLLAGKDADTAGYHFTVADFRDDQRLSLDRTELLTLSACETGMSGAAGNGREVDGLGATAQYRGARAVMSSLWEVNDASTGALMADFYRQWAAGKGSMPKVEALRKAQLDLLQGRITPQTISAGRGVSPVENAPAGQPASSGFAHPYYWAPFVLMGNWK